MRRLERVVLLACALAACGKEEKEGGGGHAHDELGPHGGEVLDLGNGAYHLEILHDHEGGSMRVWVLDGALKETLRVPAPVVNLVTKGGPVQLTLSAESPDAEGRALEWRGAHEGLKADPWDGRIVLAIGGKTYQSPLEGEAHKH